MDISARYEQEFVRNVTNLLKIPLKITICVLSFQTFYTFTFTDSLFKPCTTFGVKRYTQS